MKGTRPFDNDEIRWVSGCFTGTFEVCNRGLFVLGVSTGGRISELLSLRVDDVFQNGTAVTDLLYTKRIVKGGMDVYSGRFIHPEQDRGISLREAAASQTF